MRDKHKTDQITLQDAGDVAESIRRLAEAGAGVSWEQIRGGYNQIQPGETVDPDDVLAEIKAKGKTSRKREKKPR